MTNNLQDFIELTKVLGFSIVVLVIGAIISMNYLHIWFGVRFCDDCRKEIDKRINK